MEGLEDTAKKEFFKRGLKAVGRGAWYGVAAPLALAIGVGRWVSDVEYCVHMLEVTRQMDAKLFGEEYKLREIRGRESMLKDIPNPARCVWYQYQNLTGLGD